MLSLWDNTNLVAAFLLCDSISCFRHSIPSKVSGSESAPPLFGNVADASRREDASPLSLPGPFTDSDSEPCGFQEECELWRAGDNRRLDGCEGAEKQLIAAKHEKSHHEACLAVIGEPVHKVSVL